MNKLLLFIFSWLLLLCIVQSCKHYPPDIIPLINDTTTITNRPCSPDTVYYAKDIQPIFNVYCSGNGCHSGSNPPEKLDLTTYSNAMASGKIKPYNSAKSKLYEAITETDPDDVMPASGALPADKIALIKKWMDQGAKDLYCSDMSKPCDTSNVSFSNTIVSIFTDNCIGCHGTNGGVTLSNYNGVKAVVNNNKLWNAIAHNHLPADAQKNMPPNGKLSECNLRQIEIWINKGAPDN